jgi:hypothetical protein
VTTLAFGSITGIWNLQKDWNTFPSNQFSASAKVESLGPIRVTADYIGNPQTWEKFRKYVLHQSRRKMASDRREKVYALLGLLLGMNDENGNRLITPDYSATKETRVMYRHYTQIHGLGKAIVRDSPSGRPLDTKCPATAILGARLLCTSLAAAFKLSTLRS